MNALKKLSTKLAILVGTCLATYFVFEVALRVVTMRKNIYTIEMVKYAKTLKMKDPEHLMSHVHVPNGEAHLMGVDINLNEYGHRGTAYPLDQKTKKVLVLGSSITMGWGVKEKDTFTTVTQNLLNQNKPFEGVEKFHIANAGIGNYNSAYQFELFQRQYPKLQPDAVMLHYFINDAEPNPTSSNPLAKYSYLAAYLNSELRGLYFRFFGARDLASYYSDLYQSQRWSGTKKRLKKIYTRTAKDNVPFFVMIVPDTHNLEPGSRYEAIYKKIERELKAEGIPTTNLFGVFQQRFGNNESKLWVQLDDPHPNAKGHALMANAFYDYLLTKNPMKLRLNNSKRSLPHT